MNHKVFFTAIAYLQTCLLAISVLILIGIPSIRVFWDFLLTNSVITLLFTISLASVFFVMAIRPLADIFSRIPFLRPLVILRKGFGVLSASLIVSLMLAKIVTDGSGYLYGFLTDDFWRIESYAFLAHLGDVTGVILLITSNTFSKKLLGKNWKRIQKLAYVYFYAGAVYELLAFGSSLAAVALVTVTTLVLIAWYRNHFILQPQTV